MTKKSFSKKAVCILLAICMVIPVLFISGCGSTDEKGSEQNTEKSSGEHGTASGSGDLMEGIVPNKVSGKSADAEFILNSADFAAELFKKSVNEKKDDGNILISPLSVMLALAMTANGADGNTKAEMQKLLGGKLTEQELNEYLYSYVKSLPSEEKAKLEIANSIWIKDGGSINVEPEFLQKNADYYGAGAFRKPFDNSTVADINAWISEHTDKMIDKMIEEISSDSVMFLINAICFDAEWKHAYDHGDVFTAEFRSYDGKAKNVDMMNSEEYKYLSDSDAEGFMKPYVNERYAFAALLPNEGTDIYDYVNSLSGEKIVNILKNRKTESVNTFTPKFTYDFNISMKDILRSMGMRDAFDSISANLSKIGYSPVGNLFVSDVAHKTYISLDEKGTKAAAVTVVTVDVESAMECEHTVRLDRPFMYMIVDTETNLPIFIGIATDLGEK